jgi:hypothetical protein
MRFRHTHPAVFVTEIVKKKQVAEVVENKQTKRRGQIALFPHTVDLRNQFRQRHAVFIRDAFQACPEGILKTDAGLVSANDDRAFNHRGFHLGPPETPPSPVMNHNGDSKTDEVAEYRRQH